MQSSRNRNIGNNLYTRSTDLSIGAIEARFVQSERPLHFRYSLEEQVGCEIDRPFCGCRLSQFFAHLGLDDRVDSLLDESVDNLAVDNVAEMAITLIDLDRVLSVAAPSVHAVGDAEANDVLFSVGFEDDSAIAQEEGVLDDSKVELVEDQVVVVQIAVLHAGHACIDNNADTSMGCIAIPSVDSF